MLVIRLSSKIFFLFQKSVREKKRVREKERQREKRAREKKIEKARKKSYKESWIKRGKEREKKRSKKLGIEKQRKKKGYNVDKSSIIGPFNWKNIKKIHFTFSIYHYFLNGFLYIQSAKILLVPLNCDIIMVLLNCSFSNLAIAILDFSLWALVQLSH